MALSLLHLKMIWIGVPPRNHHRMKWWKSFINYATHIMFRNLWMKETTLKLKLPRVSVKTHLDQVMQFLFFKPRRKEYFFNSLVNVHLRWWWEREKACVKTEAMLQTQKLKILSWEWQSGWDTHTRAHLVSLALKSLWMLNFICHFHSPHLKKLLLSFLTRWKEIGEKKAAFLKYY